MRHHGHIDASWLGSFLATLGLSGLLSAALPAPASLEGEWDSQFQMLCQDLSQRATFARVAQQTLREEALILESDRDPADVLLRRTTALLADLQQTSANPELAPLEKQLVELRQANAGLAVTNLAARRALFEDVCRLRRQIAFRNPLLNFDQLLFLKRHRALFDHMCDQFYGMAARPGGGLFVLDDPFGPSPRVRDLLADARVENGRLKGQRLFGATNQHLSLSFDGMGNLRGQDAPGGSFLSPSLSYDGKTILFAYVECAGDKLHRLHTDSAQGHWAEGRCFHIFKVGADGAGLRQLTDGTWNDFDPCWLPNGRIAFITERRGGYLRCGRVCPLYNLYDMAADGSGLNCLSFHESNEWQPSVTQDGRIIYTRWDYVDRHGCTAHFPWITKLDGTDARALHGNFAPRQVRPDMELNVRAIPGSPKYVATAAPHHGQAFGSLVVIDPQVPDDDGMGPVKRLTPEVAFPESQGGRQVYGTPWPLSEHYYLCVYDAEMQQATGKKGGSGNYGLYLLDCFGNRELIYRDPDIGCSSPIPLRSTPQPAIAASSSLASTAPSESASPGQHGQAAMTVINVYDSIRPWPKGTTIKELRIFQVLPMSVPSGGPPHETGKRIAEAGDSVVPVRWVLGTVPVEADGSASFTVPAYREVFFQALDERGLAVQSMRSAAYARNGEHLVCQGCHEPKSRASAASTLVPLALQRAPSTPKPDVDGSNPFSYPRLVQPVLDRNCVKCHEENRAKAPNLAREPIQHKWYASYNSLVKYGFTSYGDGYRTIPGKFGARASKLLEMLDQGHHKVDLSGEDYHRLALWLDSASMFYGVFEKEGGEAQLAGGIPKPTLE